MQKPDILMLDEPDAHLDGDSLEILVTLFRHVLDRGTGILFTSHSDDFIHRLDQASLSMIDYCIGGNQVEI